MLVCSDECVVLLFCVTGLITYSYKFWCVLIFAHINFRENSRKEAKIGENKPEKYAKEGGALNIEIGIEKKNERIVLIKDLDGS